MTPDEICIELYGAAKPALLHELTNERRRVKYRGTQQKARSRYRTAQPVDGPTYEAMVTPAFWKYIEMPVTP